MTAAGVVDGLQRAFSPYHSQYFAHRLTLAGVGEDAFAKSLSTAKVDMNPHQVDAALFALERPLTRGILLADEVGLGKTIEAALVIAQRWAERKRRILLIVPASLRKQWSQELWDKFGLNTVILEGKTYRERKKAGHHRPFEAAAEVVVTSYEFASRYAEEVGLTAWDLVVFDEAHRLRNVYKKEASQRAKRLKDYLRAPFKILLTATPLQNNIMELYGLVSMIDDHVFGDEKSFRTLYGGRPDPAHLMVLRDRLKPICRRTLRRVVQEAGHISYTRRNPVTFRFDPSQGEVELYERVSEFLQRPDTVYLGGKPNALVTMSLRKILGSSSYAMGLTLEHIVERLKALEAVTPDDLAEDLDTIDETAEEWGEGGETSSDGEPITRERIAAEVIELEAYRDLARSIQVNAKGDRLATELPGLLDEIVRKRGQRKAVIFTESVRTQTYLAGLLREHGFEGQIARLNGSNNDPDSARIYAEWLARHKGTDKLSGSKSADMKAAIVEAFRDDKTILIATESGAEGINLQFCSLLVNYDLPWNPQRVEQRIGRCHRYGQKIDVTVVNFLNTKNRAEERVFELLAEKFQLFDGVFGASDEVLGAIENGIDFEQRVHQIMQTARTVEEVEAAFNELTESLQPQIEADLKEARDKLLVAVDQDVVRLLRNRQDDLRRVLSTFEQRLEVLARAELPEAAFWRHEDGSPCFEHDGETWTTGWPLADDKNWKFFRLTDDNLATDLVAAAKGRALPVGTVVFDYAGHMAAGGLRLTDIEPFRGSAGWMRVSLLSMTSAGRTVDHILVAARTDDGEPLDERHIDRLFLVPHESWNEEAGGSPPEDLDVLEAAAKAERLAEAGRDNERWMAEETEKYDRYAEDLEVAADEEIKRLGKEVKDRKKALRVDSSLTVERQVAERRAIKKIEAQIDDLKMETYQRRRKIRAEVDDLLDQIQASLALAPKTAPIFTLRWELRG